MVKIVSDEQGSARVESDIRSVEPLEDNPGKCVVTFYGNHRVNGGALPKFERILSISPEAFLWVWYKRESCSARLDSAHGKMDISPVG